MGKKYLFLTESYFYNPSPNGNCVQKIAENLVQNGNEVFVLTLKNQVAKKDEVLNGVKVNRVNTYFDWKISFSSKPKIIKKVLLMGYKFIKVFLTPWHPLRAPITLNSLVRKGKTIVKKENIDVVMGVYRDYETAWASIKLKKKSPNLKSVIYTLDAVSGGVCSNKMVSEKTHKRKCVKKELAMLKLCDLYCAMQSHKQLYSASVYDEYRDKIRYLDVPTFLPNEIDVYDNYTASEEEIKFCFTGMLSETNADCRRFLEVFKVMSQIEPRIRWDIYGAISNGIMEEIEKTELCNKKIFFHGRVDKTQLVEIRKNADVFLSFGNEHFCGIPCKIFEYFSTGKIVVSFYKIEEDASRPYLQKYSKACVLPYSGESAQNQAEKILEFYRTKKNEKLSKEEILNQFYSNTPSEIVELLLSL